MRFILRTTLVAALAALAWTAALETPAKAQASGSDYFVYFGTYTRGPSKGIYAYRFEPAAGKFTPLNPKVVNTLVSATNKIWPGKPVIPLMETGGTDGIYLRGAGIPTYGVSGIFGDEDDVRAHGRDERILVKSFYEGLDFMYLVCTGLGRVD